MAGATDLRGSGPSPAVAGWRAQINPVVGHGLFGVAYRVRRPGRATVPATGPLLFVGNHVGVVDGPLLAAYSPRLVSMLVKREMFAGPMGRFLTFIGHIPISRGAGDREALAAATTVLRGGGAVGIFPEGTRGRGDVSQVQQGAAWLALQTGAAIVPVAFLGTRVTGRSAGSLPCWRSPMAVVFGAPFAVAVQEGASGRQRLGAATAQIQLALATHVGEASATHGLGLPEDDGWQGIPQD